MSIIIPSSTTIADLEQKYRPVPENLEELNQRKNEILSEIASILVNTDGANVIVIQGSTPSFNDGDPCTHSQNVYINYLSKYGESCGEDEAESVYPVTYSDAIWRAFRVLDSMESAIEDVFGTNWQLTFKRAGDSVTWEKDDYDCGY